MKNDDLLEYAVTYEVTWRTYEIGVCEKCLALEGETWRLPSLEGTLIHSTQGAVWDLDADISLMHAHCRCYPDVEVYVDVGDGVMVSIADAKLQVEDLKTKITSIEMDYHDIRMLEVAMIRIGSALGKLTGSEEIKSAVMHFNRLIWTIRMTQIAIHTLEIASGPIGWLYFGATALGLGVMAGSIMYDGSRGT